MNERCFSNRVILYECIGFLMMLSLIWVDEIFDLPHVVFGTTATPLNWAESLFESVFILAGGLVIIRRTACAARKIRRLEGLIPICASCKKIRDDKGYWQQAEVYIREHSAAEFSHSICPDCAKKLYPDMFDTKVIEKLKASEAAARGGAGDGHGG